MLQHENIFIMNTAFPVCLLNLKVLVLFITYLTFTYMAASSHVGSGSKDVSAPGITPSRRASIRGQSGFLVIRTLKALMLGCCSSVQHSTQSSSVSVGKNKQKRRLLMWINSESEGREARVSRSEHFWRHHLVSQHQLCSQEETTSCVCLFSTCSNKFKVIEKMHHLGGKPIVICSFQNILCIQREIAAIIYCFPYLNRFKSSINSMTYEILIW